MTRDLVSAYLILSCNKNQASAKHQLRTWPLALRLLVFRSCGDVGNQCCGTAVRDACTPSLACVQN